ncbi:uncharacterized protein LOC143483786 [Brachyhypopomus gauderio]|uniref:uncharacterized protein LOC143483786 n=1 Tax=Brachyhypopomus gauderio TaxID=698409 RepID=UPI00404204AC
MTADSRREDLEKELGSVLNETLQGLEKLQHFMDAVERVVSPLLIHFKRDAGAFFMPSLFNVEVLAFQLDKYIRTTQQLCERMKEKMDESFRMTFLFGGEALRFIGLFSQCGPRMLQFLSELEEDANQLDKMKLGFSISTVAGSSVGIAGGVLSIVGLALAPVTAGVSLALTLTGVGLGVTSGVNSLVTGITEIAVKSHRGKKANNTFKRFMDDVQKVLNCLQELDNREVAKGIDAVVDGASAMKVLVVQEAKIARGIPNLTADLPDIGQLAKGAPLAQSKSARAGFIGLNALFIGVDALFICKESISLAKGKKSETSHLIRSRSALWRSELEAWEKIFKCLCKGIWKFCKSQKILEQPFHTNKC